MRECKMGEKDNRKIPRNIFLSVEHIMSANFKKALNLILPEFIWREPEKIAEFWLNVSLLKGY